VLRLAHRAAGDTGEIQGVALPLSRQDLAELSGTTLSTASRTLSGWARQGLVAAGRERVTILQPGALAAIAENP
ncbi:MAG: winged helix-turn-helix domain-containing protein, partial [Chloroflexi bacterium]|nr:winged helix-turn-helix domain-containing protein [Chloroflexota bacterium]